MGEKTPLLAKKGDQHNRGSVRGSVAFPFYPSHRGGEGEGDTRGYKATVEPIEALSALAPGGVIKIAGVGKFSKPLSIGKSIPADAPYRRTARHRAFYLWWINEFRHWWKSSRLLVRLGGLETYAVLNWIDMTLLSATSRKAMKHAFKYAKRMGQAGVMRHFLKVCHPFTRSVRILVAAWRWVESAPCRRLEVGVEETLVSSVCLLSVDAADSDTIKPKLTLFACVPLFVCRPLWVTVSHACLLALQWTPSTSPPWPPPALSFAMSGSMPRSFGIRLVCELFPTFY